MANGLATFFAFAFQVPLVLGYGPHWELDATEAAALGRAWDAALQTLPSKTAKAINAILSKYMPLLAAVGTTYVITKPRVQKTKKLIEEMQRRAEEHARATNGGPFGGGEKGGDPLPS